MFAIALLHDYHSLGARAPCPAFLTQTMDDSDIDQMVWVDTAAVAERTWSPGSSTGGGIWSEAESGDVATDPALTTATTTLLKMKKMNEEGEDETKEGVRDPYNITDAAERIIPHRCRLYQRGIRAKPVDSRDIFGRRRFQVRTYGRTDVLCSGESVVRVSELRRRQKL